MLSACQQADPRLPAERFWNAVFQNDMDGVRNYASSASVAFNIVGDEILPLGNLKNVRIRLLMLQESSDANETSAVPQQGGLAEYQTNKNPLFALGNPLRKENEVTIPTTLFADWEGTPLTWHLNTRMIMEEGEWKVDFMSLKYILQQQIDADTREVTLKELIAQQKAEKAIRDQMLKETSLFSRSVNDAIRGNVRAMTR